MFSLPGRPCLLLPLLARVSPGLESIPPLWEPTSYTTAQLTSSSLTTSTSKKPHRVGMLLCSVALLANHFPIASTPLRLPSCSRLPSKNTRQSHPRLKIRQHDSTTFATRDVSGLAILSPSAGLIVTKAEQLLSRQRRSEAGTFGAKPGFWKTVEFTHVFFNDVSARAEYGPRDT